MSTRAVHPVAAPSRPSRRRRPTRRNVVTAFGVALVLALCMVGFRLSEATRPYELRHARLGQWTSFQGGRVLADGLQVARRVRGGGDVATTPGLFVVVVLTVQADRRAGVDVDDAQLVAGNRTYDPYEDLFDASAPAGWETATPVLFEIDPADLDGLVLRYADRGVVYRYYTTVQVPLVVTGADADARTAAAGGTDLSLPEPTSRVLP